MTARWLATSALLAACGSSVPPFPNGVDAAMPDSIPKFTGGEPSPGDVAVTVTRDGQPAAGLAVWFQGPDSEDTVILATDDQGVAAAPDGMLGFVTVLDPKGTNGSPTLMTFAATQPGDRLVLELTPSLIATPGILTVSYPSAGDGVRYDVRTPCGSTATRDLEATVAVGNCGAMTDVLIVATDELDNPLASLLGTAVPVDGASHALSGNYEPVPAESYAYANVPASVRSISTLARVFTARGPLYDRSTLALNSPPSGSLASGASVPGAAGTLEMIGSVIVGSLTDLGQQSVFDWAAPSGSYALDVTGALLPPFASAGMYSAGSHQVTWTEGSGPTTPDLVRGHIAVTRGASIESPHWEWMIVAPRNGAPTLQFPTLPPPPPGADDFNPIASDSVAVTALETASLPGGYEAFRAHGFGSLLTAVSTTPGRIVDQVLAPAQL